MYLSNNRVLNDAEYVPYVGRKHTPKPYDFDYRLSRYSLTEAEYNRLWEKQGGLCAICGHNAGRYGYHIDHDHKCRSGTTSCGGCVRGLLCPSCNISLGHYEKPGFRAGAEAYLNGNLGN